MKHISEKLFKQSSNALLLLLPCAMYIIYYRSYIATLMVGAIMLVYFMLFVTLVSNHVLKLLRILMAKKLGYQVAYNFKHVLPYSVPVGKLGFDDLIKFEVAPQVFLMILYSVALMLFKAFHVDVYYIHLVAGSALMSMTLWYGSIQRVFWALDYKSDLFEYTKRTIHVYSDTKGAFKHFDLSKFNHSTQRAK